MFFETKALGPTALSPVWGHERPGGDVFGPHHGGQQRPAAVVLFGSVFCVACGPRDTGSCVGRGRRND